MAIEIETAFDVERPPQDVWDFLVTAEKVVGCLPGARLLEAIDERTFRGEIGVRLGPLATIFRGTLRFDELDRANLRVAISGNGRERGGSSSVRMSMRSTLAPRGGGGTRVWVSQSLQFSGRLAVFGFGTLLHGMADRVFGRFAACVQRQLAAEG